MNFMLKNATLPGLHLEENLLGKPRGVSRIIDKVEEDGEIITVEDIRTFLKDLQLPSMSKKTIEEKFCEVGASKEGMTTLAHFFTFIKNELKDYENEEIVDSFLTFDVEDDGFVYTEDIRMVLSKIGEPLEADFVEKSIRMVDMDGDGTIDYQELMQVVKANEDEMLGITDEMLWGSTEKELPLAPTASDVQDSVSNDVPSSSGSSSKKTSGKSKSKKLAESENSSLLEQKQPAKTTSDKSKGKRKKKRKKTKID